MSNVTVRNADDRFEEIRRCAFELFEKRGCAPGYDLDDWLNAEREVSAAENENDSAEFERRLELPRPAASEKVKAPKAVAA